MIIFFATVAGVWFGTVARIDNNEEQIRMMQQAAIKMEQTVEKIKTKTDKTHDAVIRISTILEHNSN